MIEALISDCFLLEGDQDIAKCSPENSAPFGIERFCFPLPMHQILEFHCAKKKVQNLFKVSWQMARREFVSDFKGYTQINCLGGMLKENHFQLVLQKASTFNTSEDEYPLQTTQCLD